jgi:hypothetical protein
VITIRSMGDVEMDLTVTRLARTAMLTATMLWIMPSAALAQNAWTIEIEQNAALKAKDLPETLAGGGGKILPPHARPHGYTLEEMTSLVALFSTSGGDLQFYPSTPFQILFADPSTREFNVVDDALVESGSNTITVCPGTPFYMPMFNVTDSPPIFGTFPADASSAVSYVYDPAQLGLEDAQVVLDGATVSIGPAYLAGPVTTPPLNDGGGTHIITLGVFLSPLSVGTHTVSFSGQYAGDLIEPVVRFPVFGADFSYTVVVVPGC